MTTHNRREAWQSLHLGRMGRMPQQSTLHSTCSARVLVGRQYNMSSHIYIYIHASIEARLWWASLLQRFGTMALQRRWLGDGASSNALSISLFAPMVDPVAKQWRSRQAKGHDSCPMTAIPCQCSSGRMKPSYDKANPYIEAYCSTAIAIVCHISLLVVPQ